ncbi:MAG: HAD family hydrolase [Candidatus Paceibacterota bacterium]|jgi:hypothetical protein
MNQNKYKMIVSDIDGTLTPCVPNSFPSEKVVNSIKKAVKKGLIFSLASGRPFYLVKYIIDILGDVGPCIVDNGAAILDSKDGAVLWEEILPNESVNEILELVNSFESVKVSCEDRVINNPKIIGESLKVRKISIHNLLSEEAEAIINKVGLRFKEVVGARASSYKGEKFIDVYFSNIKATKQHAIFKLCEILGVTHKEIIGVGDGYNDFSLLMPCGLKVAMGNAVKELKEIADYVTLPVEEDGIIDVIEKFYN